MTAPSITTFLSAAETALATVEGVASCEVGRGRFSTDELASASFKVPALRVAAAAVRKLVNAGDGTRDVTLRVSVSIITRDGKDGPRERQAVALLDRLLLVLPTNPWGLDWADAPDDIDAVNAYSGKVGGAGLMVWEVAFNQIIRIGTAHPATAPEIVGATIPGTVEITHRGASTEAMTWEAAANG